MYIINTSAGRPYEDVDEDTPPSPPFKMATQKPTYLYSLSNKKSKSFHRWSKAEPVGQAFTDHWAKQKSRYYQLSQVPTGSYISFCYPEDPITLKKKPHGHPSSSGLPHSSSVAYKNVIIPRGTVAPVGDPNFNRYLVQKLHNPGLVRIPPPCDSKGYASRSRPPSSYHERAKSGFIYWQLEKKPANNAMKRTMGSVGSNLGIGSAPRT